MRHSRITWGFVSLLILAVMLVAASSLSSQGQKHVLVSPEATFTPVPNDTRDLSKFGAVEFSNAGTVQYSEARRIANKRYDNLGWVFDSVFNNPKAAGVGRVTDDPPPPAFPFEESALVVVGNIAEVKAYLSNDSGGVYSEFTINVDEVLKGEKNSSSSPKKIIADREGGVVIYPNGQRIVYQNSALALPQLGSKYLFFLTKDEAKDDASPNYTILTSYDIGGSQIYPMELGVPFEEFKGAIPSNFLDVVRRKFTQSTNRIS